MLAVIVEPPISQSSSGMVIITVLPLDMFAIFREIDELQWLCRVGKMYDGEMKGRRKAEVRSVSLTFDTGKRPESRSISERQERDFRFHRN